METWKKIKCTEDYMISSLGRVKSLKNNKVNILKNVINNKGYYKVCIKIDNKIKTERIHILVAIAFLNHKPDGHNIVVDHIDNNKLNNNISNLQLITQRENSTKDKRIGSSKYVGVHFCNTIKKFIAKIRINGKSTPLGRFDKEEDARDAYLNKLNQINRGL
jgi:hypothetical protein